MAEKWQGPDNWEDYQDAQDDKRERENLEQRMRQERIVLQRLYESKVEYWQRLILALSAATMVGVLLIIAFLVHFEVLRWVIFITGVLLVFWVIALTNKPKRPKIKPLPHLEEPHPNFTNNPDVPRRW